MVQTESELNGGIEGATDDLIIKPGAAEEEFSCNTDSDSGYRCFSAVMNQEGHNWVTTMPTSDNKIS